MQKWSIFHVSGNVFFSDFRRRRRRKIDFLAPQAPKNWFSGGGFRAIFSRKMYQNQLDNLLLSSGFSGFSTFSKRVSHVFIVFGMVFVDILRISMHFKAFWTGPSLARVHFPLHFIDFLGFIEFP